MVDSQAPQPAAAAATADDFADLFVDDAELGRCKREFKLRSVLKPSDKEGIAAMLRPCIDRDQHSFKADYCICGIILRLDNSSDGPSRVLLARERFGQKRYVAVKLIEQEDTFDQECDTYGDLSALEITVRKLHDYPPHALVLEYATPLRRHLDSIHADNPLPFVRLFQRAAHMLHTLHLKKIKCYNDFNVDQVVVLPLSHGEASLRLTDLESVTRKNQSLPPIRAHQRKYLAPEVCSYFTIAIAIYGVSRCPEAWQSDQPTASNLHSS
jgi:hypothetical protein